MNPLLRDLLVDAAHGDLVEFQRLSRTYGCRAGNALYSPGDTPRGLTLVVAGRIAVDRDGERMAELGPGSHFGERTLVGDEPIGVHLLALEDTECLEFPAAAARGFIDAHPAFGFAVMKALFAGNVARLNATSRAFLEKRALALELEQRNRELSDSLARAAALQEELVAARHLAGLGTVVAGVAHEINNPLAYVAQSVHTALERAREPAAGADERIARPLERALEGVERIRAIVADLQAGQPAPPDGGSTAVSDEVSAALDLVAAHATAKDVRCVTSPAEGLRVAMAHGRLCQVLVNLVRNAVDASPRGAAVTLDAARDGDAIVIQVTDRGAGIPADVRARIFDPFFTTKPVGQGTGLGLWVCQGLVARAGGSIACRSAPGGGTTFTVRIPAGGPA